MARRSCGRAGAEDTMKIQFALEGEISKKLVDNLVKNKMVDCLTGTIIKIGEKEIKLKLISVVAKGDK